MFGVEIEQRSLGPKGEGTGKRLVLGMAFHVGYCAGAWTSPQKGDVRDCVARSRSWLRVSGWRWGLENRVSDARGFYGVIAISVLCGLLLQYSPITPMKALFWSAVINGVVAVPLIVIVILRASKRSVLGPYTSGRTIIIFGWIAVAVMGVAALRMILPG
jgi:Mn2+/Fe2+ NRAMP family transporter